MPSIAHNVTFRVFSFFSFFPIILSRSCCVRVAFIGNHCLFFFLLLLQLLPACLLDVVIDSFREPNCSFEPVLLIMLSRTCMKH